MDDRPLHRLVRPSAALACLIACRSSWAHVPGAEAAEGVEVVVEQSLFALLVVAGVLYAAGVTALWRHAGLRRGLRTGDVAAFACGWASLVISLSAPVDALSDASFAAHMLQHEVMMVVAAPLMVVGRPLEAWAWAIGIGSGSSRLRWTRARPIKMASTALRGSLVAWILHAAALWGWHIPALFRAALAHPGLHLAQHACFFGTALIYWSSVLGDHGRRPSGASIASVFTTMLHTSALGALLTFAPVAWYMSGDDRLLGMTALEDQQLGGLIMWVPGSMAYLLAGLAIVSRWLARSREPAWL